MTDRTSDVINGEQPAAPSSVSHEQFQYSNTEYLGLSKREAFAMAAMQGMSSHPDFYGQSKDFADNIAKDSVAIADALLKELSNES